MFKDNELKNIICEIRRKVHLMMWWKKYYNAAEHQLFTVNNLQGGPILFGGIQSIRSRRPLPTPCLKWPPHSQIDWTCGSKAAVYYKVQFDPEEQSTRQANYCPGAGPAHPCGQLKQWPQVANWWGKTISDCTLAFIGILSLELEKEEGKMWRRRKCWAWTLKKGTVEVSASSGKWGQQLTFSHMH